MSDPIKAIGGVKNKFSETVEGFGSRVTTDNLKKLLFEDGKVVAGNVPHVNTGSTFGYGFAASGSKTLAATDM